MSRRRGRAKLTRRLRFYDKKTPRSKSGQRGSGVLVEDKLHSREHLLGIT